MKNFQPFSIAESYNRMKQFNFILLMVLALTACSKNNKLNQPCTLNFSTEFTACTTFPITITQGEVAVKRIEFSGNRLEGEDVDISVNGNQTLSTFLAGGSWENSMDIPIGTYSQYELYYHLKTADSSAFILKGTATINNVIYPMTIIFSSDISLDTEGYTSPELVKNSNYTAKLTINLDNLFNDMNAYNWQNLVLTSVNGITTLLISDSVNEEVFEGIQNHLNNSLSIQVQ